MLNLYPIFDEEYRTPLNDMIVRYFWMWEIGFETPMQFRQALLAKMAIIMPKYNIMFKARNLTTQPLVDHDYVEEHKEKGTKDTTNTDNEYKQSEDIQHSERELHSKTNVTDRQSDTPQQNLNNLGYGTDEAFINQWLTYGEIQNTDTTENETIDKTDNYTHHIGNLDIEDTDTTREYLTHNVGRMESQQKLAKQLYETAYDIEVLIINDLKCLFMGLYMS